MAGRYHVVVSGDVLAGLFSCDTVEGWRILYLATLITIITLSLKARDKITSKDSATVSSICLDHTSLICNYQCFEKL